MKKLILLILCFSVVNIFAETRGFAANGKCLACNGRGVVANPDYKRGQLGSHKTVKCANCRGFGWRKTSGSSANAVDKVKPARITFLGLQLGQCEAETLKGLGKFKPYTWYTIKGVKTCRFYNNNRIKEVKATVLKFYDDKLLEITLELPNDKALMAALKKALTRSFGKPEKVVDLDKYEKGGLKIIVGNKLIICTYEPLEKAIAADKTVTKTQQYNNVF
jgi:hypothetical protein